MKIALKIVGGLVAFVVVVFIGLSIYVATLDASTYRPQIAHMLSEKTGRAVSLNGPIGFSLGLNGVKIVIQDASIANPAWASRPDMAAMGKIELDVDALALFDKRISINKLAIENADILLESNAAGQHNWDIGAPLTASAPRIPTPPASASTSAQLSLGIDQVSVINSQIGLRAADGKTAIYSVSSLKLTMLPAGVAIDFTGAANGASVTMRAKTGITNLLNPAAFPFDADLTYGLFHLTAQGKADLDAKRATIDSYKIVAGKTALTGNALVHWGGARPLITGTIDSDNINPADFKITSASTSNGAGASAPVNAPTRDQRMFSAAPLPLSALKAANIDVQADIRTLVVGKGVLKNVSAKLNLTDGNLAIAPIKATVGDRIIQAQVRLDATQSPAHLTVGVIGDGVDLGEAQKLAGLTPFLSGQASANIQLTGQGDSAQAIAASLGGVITITAEKGEIIGNALSGVSSALAAVFNPAGQDAAINCLAARFIVKGGIVSDNGILIDSAASTVVGKGGVNLGAETVNLTLNAKTKLVDIGGLMPPLLIDGTLTKPRYKVDAKAAIKNIVGNLMNGDLMVTGNAAVPQIQAAPVGQNACVFTLDHPQAAASAGVLPADTVSKTGRQIKNIGNTLLKGLFGQ